MTGRVEWQGVNEQLSLLQDDMVAIQYTLHLPNNEVITLEVSEPFVARGKSSKRRRIRSPSPVGVLANPQAHVNLVVWAMDTKNLPLFLSMQFVESQGMIF